MVSFINKRQSASPLPSSAGYESQKSVPVFIFSHFSRLARPVSRQKRRTIIGVDRRSAYGWTNRCKCLLIQCADGIQRLLCIFGTRRPQSRQINLATIQCITRTGVCRALAAHERTCSRLLYLPSRWAGGEGGKSFSARPPGSHGRLSNGHRFNRRPANRENEIKSLPVA